MNSLVWWPLSGLMVLIIRIMIRKGLLNYIDYCAENYFETLEPGDTTPINAVVPILIINILVAVLLGPILLLGILVDIE